MVIGHNGIVFEYRAMMMIDIGLYNAYIDKYITQNYTEEKAQIEALDLLKKHEAIDFWEVT